MADPRQQDLAARIRTGLPPGRVVREVPMFGGLSFMLDNRMIMSVRRDGSLLVRVDPDRSSELLSVPGARPAVMGANRSMGPGWLTVAAEGLTTEQQLTDWIEVALQHHQAAT